jgi:hypothetical protein
MPLSAYRPSVPDDVAFAVRLTLEIHMSSSSHLATADLYEAAYPVDVTVTAQLEERNRLTCAFRLILAIPHLVLVGGPIALAISMVWYPEDQGGWGAGGGVFGAVAAVIAIIAWFAILFTGRFPKGLWAISAMYMRWRVRAVAYLTMLRDEYPPFGDGQYGATLVLPVPRGDRNRVTVAFRLILVLPHLFVLWILGIAWAISTIIAWFAILFTGNFPPALYDFAVGVLRWSTRVEAYMLLLRDEYPPFSLN